MSPSSQYQSASSPPKRGYMMRVTVRLMGSVEIRDADGSELDSLPGQSKLFGLLSYLLTAHPRGFHRRDKLVVLFWPEAGQEQARHSLSQALHVLRDELGETVVISRGDGDVAIDDAAISCDAVEFEKAVEAGEHEKALELYRGDFLEGWFVRDAPEFERWLEDERTRLREKAAGVAWALAHEHISAGCLVDAERTAQRALMLVTTDESEVRRFIQALADAGDRAAAVRFYEKFAQRLSSQYEIEPDPVTAAVAQALAKDAGRRHHVAGAPVEASAARQASFVTPSGGAMLTDTRPIKIAFMQSRKVPLGVAVVAVVVAVIATALLLLRGGGGAFDPDRVLVVTFADNSRREETEILGRWVQDYIIQVLTDAGFAEVVDPFTALLVSQNVTAGASATAPGDILALADGARAGTVVSGSYYAAGDSVHIQARITDARNGRLMRTVGPTVGPISGLPQLVARLGQEVVAELAPLLDQELGSFEPTVQPATYEAYQAYSEGSETALQGGAAEAARHFERAAAADTTFYRATLRAAQSYQLAGRYDAEWAYYAKAESLIAALVQSRAQLTRYERCQLDFVMTLGPRLDLGVGYETARCMAQAAPGSDDAKRELALFGIRFNRPAEVIEVLKELDPDRGVMKHCECYWPVLTFAHHMLGDYERELELAREAWQHHGESPGLEIPALAALGRLDDVAANVEAMRSLPSGSKLFELHGMVFGERLPEDWATLGLYLGYVGLVLRTHGHHDAARQLFDEAIAWYRSRPHDTEEPPAHLAWLLYQAARWDEAFGLTEELAQEYPENTEYLAALGKLAARRGDREAALRISEQLRSSPYVLLERAHSLERARIAALLGEREVAMTLLQQAIEQGVNWGYGVWVHRDIDLESLHDYPPFQEFIRPKG